MTINATEKSMVKEAVIETLIAFGIDVSHPEGVMNFQQDMHYLRSNRLRDRGIQNKALQHGVTVIVSGIFAALVLTAAQFIGIRIEP